MAIGPHARERAVSALNLRRGAIALGAFLVLSTLIAALSVPPWPYATPLAAGVAVLVAHLVEAALDRRSPPTDGDGP